LSEGFIIDFLGSRRDGFFGSRPTLVMNRPGFAGGHLN
jgi:hypothetical protein